MSLLLVQLSRNAMSEAMFNEFGWRIPFVASAVLLVLTVYMRLRLRESPVFAALVRDDALAAAPLHTAFLTAAHGRRVLLALFGACAGQGAVWYCGQYYALFFMTRTLHLDEGMVTALLGGALLAGLPLFLLFGALSDRFGRLRFIVGGCALAAVSYFWMFGTLARAINPDLMTWRAANTVTVAADDCHFHLFVGPWTSFSPCDQARGQLANLGVPFIPLAAGPREPLIVTVNDVVIRGYRPDEVESALAASGFHPKADPAKVDKLTAFGVLLAMVATVAIVYGPIGALLVGMFPANIRYSAISLPYHIGNGWFGGVLPLMAAAMVVSSGDIFAGLYYPVGVAAFTAVVGGVFILRRRNASDASVL